MDNTGPRPQRVTTFALRHCGIDRVLLRLWRSLCAESEAEQGWADGTVLPSGRQAFVTSLSLFESAWREWLAKGPPYVVQHVYAMDSGASESALRSLVGEAAHMQPADVLPVLLP